MGILDSYLQNKQSLGKTGGVESSSGGQDRRQTTQSSSILSAYESNKANLASQPVQQFQQQPQRQENVEITIPTAPNLFQQAGKSFLSGVGNAISISGSAARWLGADGIANKLSQTAERFHENAPVLEPTPFEWKKLYDPRFYATTAAQAVGTTVPLAIASIPAAIVGAYAGTAAAGAVGLGSVGAFVLSALGAGALRRPIESAFEAGGVYDEALAKGKTEAEANEAAEKTFKGNLSLASLDALEIGLSFLPVKGGGIKNIFKRAILGITSAGLEGVEEVIQSKIGTEAQGEEFDIASPETQEEFAVGTLLGGGLPIAGNIFNTITEKTKTEFQTEFDKIKKADESKADLTIIDEIADKHPKQVKKIVDDVIQSLGKDSVVDPDQAMTIATSEGMKNTPEGQELMLKAMEAKESDSRIRIILPDGKAKPVIEIVDKSEKIRVTGPEVTPEEIIGKDGEVIEEVKIVEVEGEGAKVSVIKVEDASKFTSVEDYADAQFGAKPENQIGDVDPNTITARDAVDKESKKYQELLADIKKNGFQEPVRVTIEKGEAITTEGSNRVTIAQELGIDVPVIVNKGQIEGLRTIAEEFADITEEKVTPTPPPVEKPSKEGVVPEVKGVEPIVGEGKGKAAKKPTEKKEKDTDQEFDFDSTQLDLPKEQSDKIIAFGEKIPDAELYTEDGPRKFGREDEPHITVLFGLDETNESQVRQLAKESNPIEVSLGEVSLFETDDKFDVVKVGVEGKKLRALNKKLDDALDTPGKTFDDYNPHVTIAYVKKGEGAKYARDKSFVGEKITIDELVFSGKDGKQVVIPLEGDKPLKGVLEKKKAELEKKRAKAKAEPKAKVEKAPKKITTIPKGFKESRVIERVKDTLRSEVDLTETIYKTLTLDDVAKASVDLVNHNPRLAKDIIDGNAPVPENMTKASVLIASAEQARKAGDFQTQKDLILQRSFMQTRHGQEIVTERLVNDLSSDRFIRDVLKVRMDKVVGKLKKGTTRAKSFADKVSSNTRGATKKVNKQVLSKIQSAQKLIDSITC